MVDARARRISSKAERGEGLLGCKMVGGLGLWSRLGTGSTRWVVSVVLRP